MQLSRIALASDHQGVVLKSYLCAILKKSALDSLTLLDLGPEEASPSVDYPHFVERLSQTIQEGKADAGILICGTGIGMSMVANRYSHLRAALVENTLSSRLSREHNDANVLCLGAHILGPLLALEIVQTWLKTPFSGEIRHVQRLKKGGLYPPC